MTDRYWRHWGLTEKKSPTLDPVRTTQITVVHGGLYAGHRVTNGSELPVYLCGQSPCQAGHFNDVAGGKERVIIPSYEEGRCSTSTSIPVKPARFLALRFPAALADYESQFRPKHQIKYPHENLIFLDSSFLLKWSVVANKEKEVPHACFG